MAEGRRGRRSPAGARARDGEGRDLFLASANVGYL